MSRIYLDYAATAPLAPAAREAMLPWLGPAANASSLHTEGRAARAAIDQAREAFASLWQCHFGEVLFTSSGTEACAMAILGAAAKAPRERKRILLGASEHHAVLHQAKWLRRLGFECQTIPVDREARVSVEAVEALLADDVLLVAVMHANNETGAINPVTEISQMAKAAGALVLVDAVQTMPFVNGDPWTPESLGADLLAISGHKFGAPPGIGALYLRAGTPVEALIQGGGQEREMRAGTESVALMAGMAAALKARLAQGPGTQKAARDHLAARLVEAGFVPTVTQGPVLDGHFHCRAPGITAETLLIRLDFAGISASSGAACSSGSLEPSHVLLAAGYSAEEAQEGLRFTLAPDATPDQMDEAANRIIAARPL
jgi:cysteine desulfurase